MSEDVSPPRSDTGPVAKTAASQLANPDTRVSTGPVPAERIDTALLLQIGREPLLAQSGESKRPALNIPYSTLGGVLGVLGMLGGLFVAWALPLSIAAVACAVIARRQHVRSWTVTLGLVTGIAGCLFAVPWMLYYFAMSA